MSWKDDHREEKDSLGLTWDEYHRRRFVHVEELDDMAAEIERLSDHVEAVTNSYDDMRRELAEVRIMLESEEFDP